ncbi:MULTISPECIES: MFS transporter [unclassified Cryobacterium]|uniref:MFS transporter n=1 Tax=unclassified Cryobacterium TaxID=2649013 RepID=UPI002AB48F0E|nr:MULTISPECIES: MFS transporter [unclassified Cryobacterium]MDY7542717.1 MFS transporter [Cryobacterium sp. 5B3]MEB0266357.1 MFS transporter [Cryobacterium sp. 10I5]MEB0274766.1 MFS transporter [Cryobacterium sp. 5B3]
MSSPAPAVSVSSPPLSDPAAHPRRWWLLAVLALAQLMVVLDGTIVNIALPKAQIALAMSDGDRTWVVTIYALAFGSLLLLGGRIADYWGRKRSFLVGMAGFALASMVGGLADTTTQLLIARGLQGAFAALLAPASLAILTITFPGGTDRIKAFAVYGAIGGGGAAVGLVLGGVLTEFTSWNWCLLVNVPIALVAILAAIPLMEESRAHGNTRYDLPGVILIVTGLASLVYGFSQAENGWGRVETIGFLALGVVLLVAFVVVEARATNPLLPLRVVTDRVRGGAFLVSLLTGASLLGGLFFLTLYFQIVLGYSPLRSGLASLPMTATIMVCATALSGILPKVGVRLPLTIGPVIAAAGLAWLSFVTVQDDYVLRVLPGVILLGIGLSAIFVPLQNVALAGIDAHDAGVASAAVSATQQIGGSIGTALFTALYTAAISSYLASNPATPTVQLDAFVSGYSVAFLWAAGLILLAAPISFFMIKHSKADLVGAPEIVHLG